MKHFLRHFLLSEAKKIGKMSLMFEFSISKLGYTGIFMKIFEKKIDPFFITFWTSRGKNENENGKTWKNEFDF